MTELEKIEYAKFFLDQLAHGINPVDNTPVPEGDVASNARLLGCFFYVSDVLRQVIEMGGIPQKKPKKPTKAEFSLTNEQRMNIQTSEMPLMVREIANYLNSMIDRETTKKLSAMAINSWLLSIGALELFPLSNGKQGKRPTALGRELGIFTEEKSSPYGPFTMILFSPQAQQFIYDNVEAIVGLREEKRNTHPECQGKVWSAEQDERLVDLFQKGVPVLEIAETLKRSRVGVCERLKKLGLIKRRCDAK